MAAAVASACAAGTPAAVSVDSILAVFWAIRSEPSTASPRLPPKLRTVCVMPVTSP